MGMEPQNDTRPSNPDFCGLIEGLDYGVAAVELNGKLGDVLRDLHEHARRTQASGKGEVSLKVKIAINAKGQLTFSYDASAKGPKPARAETTMWMNDEGQLVTSPPKQLPMFDESGKKPARRAAKEV